MFSKLLGLLSTAKGAAAATVIAAAGVSTGVVATNTDVQDALGNVVQNVTQASPKADASGQPVVVAARNAADKKLRDAFQNDQQKLEKLRSTSVDGSDRAKLNDIVKTADDTLRARLDKALNDIAALTLGRNGLVKASATPTATPTGAAVVTTGVSASATPRALASFTAAQQAQVDAIVTAAIADMDATTADAVKAVVALPTAEHGKPSGQPGAKPSDAGKPSEPGKANPATPSAKPTR